MEKVKVRDYSRLISSPLDDGLEVEIVLGNRKVAKVTIASDKVEVTSDSGSLTVPLVD